jgi:hypothetical protein
MQARSLTSTTPQFQASGKVLIITKGLFLRGQLYRKLKYQQLGPFIVLEKIGANIYTLKLPYNVRLHSVFHVKNLRPCPIVALHLSVHATAHENDVENDVDRIFVVKIDTVLGRREKGMLFYTHFRNEQILPVWHRLNEDQRTFALQHFLDSP